MKKKRLIALGIIFILVISQIGLYPVTAMGATGSTINGTPGIRMKVIDTKGEKPEYTGGNKILTRESDEKLNGGALVNFNGEGNEVDLKNIEYKFFKQESQPNEDDFIKSQGWEKLDPDGNKIKKLNDVVDKPGYLTWRSYDVSHMDTASSNSSGYSWSNRSHVYMNPNQEIKYQSADAADLGGQYKLVENYMDLEGLTFIIKTVNNRNSKYTMFKNGQETAVDSNLVEEKQYHNKECVIIKKSINENSKRMHMKVDKDSKIKVNGEVFQVKSKIPSKYWNKDIYVGAEKYTPKTVFYGYSKLFMDRELYAYQDYKEASKFWGYIRVDKTGRYRFGLDADDGFYGYITVDGVKKELANHEKYFTNGSASSKVDPRPAKVTTGEEYTETNLEAGKDYPIYLEYFNWGGDGKFMLYYQEKHDNTWPRTWLPANKEWFRPSKTTTPGEYADSTFTIEEGVEFPKAPGQYYIGVKRGENKGIYGPFIVAPKSILDLQRGAVNGNNFIVPGQEFEFKYTIQPQPIPIVDVGGSSSKEKLIVKDLMVKETFPDNIAIVSGDGQISGQTFTSTSKEITYKKNSISKNYEADKVEITIRLKTDENLSDLVLGSEGKAFVTYKDLDDSNAQKTFEQIKISTTKLQNLNILEVQPGREFELTTNMFSGMAANINLVQMSMPELISNIEKINGKYDIVYVGNKNDTGVHYTDIGQKPPILPQGGNNNNGTNSDSLEYYSENDITNRKAEDLIEFINSGQLTIFRKNIFNDSLKKSKLNEFEQYSSKENVRLTENINNENIKQLYNSCSKRPILDVEDCPRDFTGTLNNGTSNGYEDTKVMNFRFNLENLNTRDNYPNLMTVKLYLDKNGDGFFRDDELVKQTEPKLNGEGYSLNYRLEDSFTGMMPWKLEVQDNVTKTKAYKIGYPAYKGEKLKIRVLQLVPPRNTFSIKNMKVPLSTEYYKVNVTELTTDEFNNNYPNDIRKNSKIIKTKLNGNYDMIILGFADSFNDGDLTIDTINGIKEFIKTGQSVMFTHDTMSYHVNNYGNQSKNLTQQFRDIIGQSRYNNNSQKNKNNISYDDDEFYSDEIVHDPLPSPNKISYGFTKGILDVKNGKVSGHPTINKTYKLNEGLFTRYPYILANNAQKELNVATTHEQYFQLNLEDEDVIPWFTLNGTANNGYYYDKYDGRNNFYTYTKGNITYSGTGHTTPNSVDEHQMFINTILKAARNANHAPTLKVINIDEDKIISKSQEKFEFSFIANDVDGDKLNGDVYVDDKLVKSYQEGDIKRNEPVNVVITKGELQSLIGNKEGFTLKIVVRDSKGAIAEDNGNYTLKYFENPVLNLSIDKEQRYLVGDVASVKLQAAVQKTSDNLKTKIQNINFSMGYDNLEDSNVIKTVGSSNWTLGDITFNPNPNPEIQENTFKFNLNKSGNYVVKNTLSYDYSNFSNLGTQTVNYSYPISVKSGIIDVKVVNSDGTPFGTAKISVIKNGKEYTSVNIDQYGVKSLENCPSGSYTFSISNLPERYIVKGANSKTIDLSYDNPIQEVKFELIDKNKIGLDLISEGEGKYLVGDTANLTLKAVAHNEDENINTIIKDIRHSMQYNSNGLELTSGETWKLHDVSIFGKDINKEYKKQTKKFSFNIKEAGDYEVVNTVVYKYLDNIQETRSATHNVSVKSGKVKVKVVKQDGTPYEGITVIVKKNGEKIIEGQTASLGQYSITDQPSGNYKVSVQFPSGFTAEGGNTKIFNLDYDNAEQNIEFKLSQSASILKHGMFVNKKIQNNTDIVQGFPANLAVDFKVYDKNPDIRLTLNKDVSKVKFTLYKVDSNGKVSSPLNGDIKVYEVQYDSAGKEISTSLPNESVNGVKKTSIDLSSISGEKKLKIQLPESTTFENHYILEYKINQKAPVDTVLSSTVKVNNSQDNKYDLKVVKLPSLD
ncbi:DUF5057 domain-containing protein [Clostridium sp. ZS2-4]|uniref:DUF5057 domain-containing protein n=1 Tax=Clostridium sp. ZS2-4 TaxID=2987703 RepID=UPI00227CA2B9|nr:DUF5057 domain-containing protein [Clostridium sp. ZS2-4]MCY6355044.1 DUF5057 domain-containing protein [Clostridium sp. ZS2-4]